MHGGPTYFQADEPGADEPGADEPGPETAWWVGFDCAHAWDLPDPELVPGLEPEGRHYAEGTLARMGRDPDWAVRTQDYVIEQCQSLCVQAALALSRSARPRPDPSRPDPEAP